MEVQPKDTSKGHFYVSLVKSFVRMAAGTAFILAAFNPELSLKFIGTGGLLLIIAESLGIVEEIV
jgi:hypothetical protein